VKGLYAKARRGELANFTGIDSDYEPPQSPEVHLQTLGVKPEACVDSIVHYLHTLDLTDLPLASFLPQALRSPHS
jgi:bifunctional enzyme CysN/CysC